MKPETMVRRRGKPRRRVRLGLHGQGGGWLRRQKEKHPVFGWCWSWIPPKTRTRK